MHKLKFFSCLMLFPTLAFSAPAALKIEASEALDKTKYPASSAVDGDPKTAYCTKAASPWITVFIPADKAVESLTFTPGYQKTKAIYEANSRPRVVHVLVYDEVGDGAASKEVPLQEGFGVKTTLSIPDLKDIRASKIRFDLGSLTRAKFPEVCVSEIEIKLSPRIAGASDTDKAFIAQHRNELTLEGLDKYSKNITRLAELASRAKDTKLAHVVLQLSKANLDGIYATQYSLLLFQFVKGDPEFAVGQMRAFFQGKWAIPLEFLCNETGDVDPDVLKSLLAKIPEASEHSKAARELSAAIDKKMEKIAKEAGSR